MLDVGCSMLDARCWILDAGYRQRRLSHWRPDLVLLRTLILHDIVFLSEILNEDLLCGKGSQEQCFACYLRLVVM